ncbi:MAG: alpha/beta fold hydrolase [Alphaproteobacteria bacterium]|nr:alpha/beta fold hydrolase [Alphaproteobacteria bacterium]
MGKLKTRLTYIAIVFLLLLLVVGAWRFYQVLYGSTGDALRRAENFLFTRSTVAQLGEQGKIRYFFVTNRSKTDKVSGLEDRFSADREAALKFGLFDTRIEPSVGLGMFINPSEWFQTEEIVVENMQMLREDEFIGKLRDLVGRSPQKSLLIVIHGFRERFPSALRKTSFVGHVLDVNSPVMVFDWPGNQGSSLGGYRRARDVAAASGAELARTIELIVRDIEPEKIWLLANSMGAEVVVHAFSDLYQNPEFADADVEIEDVVLTAPDVSHDEFDTQFKREIISLARNLTVYVSSNDRALVMSRIVNRGDRRRGESTLSPDMLEEAARIAELSDGDEDLIALVDVTPVNRTRNFHNFSLETPEFFDDLFRRLTNEQAPFARPLYRVETPDGVAYWVLTPGR